MYKSAAKCCNKEVYDDQMKKAKNLGYFYKILDIKNERILGLSNRVEIQEIEFEFDYRFLSSIKSKKSNDFKYIEKVNNFDSIDFELISEF